MAKSIPAYKGPGVHIKDWAVNRGGRARMTYRVYRNGKCEATFDRPEEAERFAGKLAEKEAGRA